MKPALLALALLAGCAAPEMSEVLAYPPNETFVANADIGCLFEKGKEHLSGRVGRYTWNIAANQREAWFRAPEMLVTLSAIKPAVTEVKRHQSRASAAFMQGDELIAVLRTASCT